MAPKVKQVTSAATSEAKGKEKTLDMRLVGVNIDNVAYILGMTDRPQHQILAVTTLVQKVGPLWNLEGHNQLYPSREELDVAGREFVGLWVGMCLRQVVEEKGEKGLSPDQLTTALNTQDTALRAIVLCNRDQSNYYALASPDATNVCTAYKIKDTQVFFFPEYRDDTMTASATRKGQWSQNFKARANIQQKSKESGQSVVERSIQHKIADLAASIQLHAATESFTPEDITHMINDVNSINETLKATLQHMQGQSDEDDDEYDDVETAGDSKGEDQADNMLNYHWT